MTQLKKRLGLTIPKALHKKIVDKAEYQGTTINATCLEIFWEYFETKQESGNKKSGEETA